MRLLALTGSTGAPNIALYRSLRRHKRDQMKDSLSKFAREVHTSYSIRHSSSMTKFRLAGGDPAYIAPVI